MKRSIFLAAVATLAAGSALAQSSVTVYGRLNVTAERFRANNATTYVLNNNASRIGFKGFEDLGAASATFWGRESWVALGGAFGKVRLGNMGPTNAYFTTADYISMHNHDTGTSEDKLYLYPGAANNMIAYTSPSFGGLVVDAQVALSENLQRGRTYVLTANYDAGPLHLGGSYLQAGAGTRGAKEREYGLRALYELGDLTFGAYYIRNENVGRGLNQDRNSARGSVMYTMGPGELHVNFGKAWGIKNNGLTNDDANQLTVGYNHNLSKRTKVYTYYTRVNDDRRLYTGNYGTLAAGIRHNF